MAEKTICGNQEQPYGESPRDVRLKERLRLLERELEEKERQIEEYFTRSNAMAMEKELARIELNQIFNVASDGMWIVDDQFRVLKINRALSTMLGMRADEAIGRRCYELFRGNVCENDNCPVRHILGGEKHFECDVERQSTSGVQAFILTASRYQGVDGGLLGVLATLKEITERKRVAENLEKANQELHRLAVIDGLTQIANRRRFDECLRQEWLRMARANLPLSVILCDVDFFKFYNDHYGHLLGDHCLISVAHAIDDCVRRPSDLAARYGGEEFAVLLPNTDSNGAVFIAESIRLKVENLMIEHADSPIHKNVTLSLGIATAVPRYDVDPQLLLEASDHELYEAKRTGRNKVCVKSMDIADLCPSKNSLV